MMKSVWHNMMLCSSLICFFGCGSHSQENRRVEPVEVVVSGEEKDPTQQLINAVENGDLASLEEAVAEGGNPNTVNQEGMTLLMLAIRSQQFAVAALLVVSGADPLLSVSVGEADTEVSAFDFIDRGEASEPILLAILEKRIIDPETSKVPFFEAISDLNVDNVQWLLAKGADPNGIWKRKKTPLIHLFSITGVKDERFVNLRAIFDILVQHKNIDVQLKVGRNTALKKAKSRARRDENYQPLVDVLIGLGAE